MKRSGSADLPLHGGRVPAWLAERMVKLGTAISEAILLEYGHSELLTRLSDPFWFQALGSVMGMDWHSSGITTSVLGALKKGINPRASELGLHICGGRGKHSRNTPAELLAVAQRRGLNGDELVRTSRLTARIDNNAIADGFQIYLHSFILTATGEWAVVQQGMNPASGFARRYHWHSATVRDFTSEPHAGIVGDHAGIILNLVDRDAKPAQDALLDIVREHPDKTLAEARRLILPGHHNVRPENVDLKRLGAVLAVAYEREFRDFANLLLLENLGPRTLQTMALVAEVVHGAPARFSDPARFSLPWAVRTATPFPSRLKPTMRRSPFSVTPLTAPRTAMLKSSTASNAWIVLSGPSDSGISPKLTSPRWSRMSTPSHLRLTVAASSISAPASSLYSVELS